MAPAPAQETYLIGNAVSWNELVAACTEATGACLLAHTDRAPRTPFPAIPNAAM